MSEVWRCAGCKTFLKAAQKGQIGQLFSGLLCYLPAIGEGGVVSYLQVGERVSERSPLITDRREKMKDLDIYEVEYSCSPGGVDKWEIQERDGEFFKGDFDTPERAISYALREFEGKEINLNVKSLITLQSSEKREVKQEILEKTNAILTEYKSLVLRFWDLYEEMEQEDAELVTQAGENKWFKHAFAMSLDELWHETVSWELTMEDLQMEEE